MRRRRKRCTTTRCTVRGAGGASLALFSSHTHVHRTQTHTRTCTNSTSDAAVRSRPTPPAVMLTNSTLTLPRLNSPRYCWRIGSGVSRRGGRVGGWVGGEILQKKNHNLIVLNSTQRGYRCCVHPQEVMKEPRPEMCYVKFDVPPQNKLEPIPASVRRSLSSWQTDLL